MNLQPLGPLAPSIETSDPRLSYEVRLLGLSARGQRACRQLGVRTILDFLNRDRADFVRLRNCGDRTYEDIALQVRELLAAPVRTTTTARAANAQRSLHELIRNPRADRAFRALGLKTVGDFLSTPKDELLAVRGFGERTYWQVIESIRDLEKQETPTPTASLLPPSLVSFEVDRLGVSELILHGLRTMDVHTVGQLLEVPTQDLSTRYAIGEPGIQSLREALETLVSFGIQATEAAREISTPPDFAHIMDQILATLDPSFREVLIQRVGLHGVVRTRDELAADLGLSTSAVRQLEDATRKELATKAPTFVTQFCSEAREELRVQGSLRCDRFRIGTLLHSASLATSDPMLPLRILRYLQPNEFFLHGDTMSTLSPPIYRQLRREVRRSCSSRHLPVPIHELSKKLEHIVRPVPIGAVVDMVLSRGDLEIRIDPDLGEVVRRKGESVADRLHDILVEAGEPKTLEDILFIYRDLHRAGNLLRLLDHMRCDDRFLEVGRATWSIRSLHVDELFMAEPAANEIIEEMVLHGTRKEILRDASANTPERRLFLLIDCMRRDPRVRYLGKGRFCVRGLSPAVMDDISESMRRAMGEIVVSRFVDNQPRDRQRLAMCLLKHNRALVETAPDRVDLLTNYPFTGDRLARMFDLIGEELKGNLGYARAADLTATICETDLGGRWLTEHMVIDLVRRHAQFEILPGGFIALGDLGLGGWIQRKIRACLRDAEQPMGVEDILESSPEIQDFSAAIDALVEQDPMIQEFEEAKYLLL